MSDEDVEYFLILARIELKNARAKNIGVDLMMPITKHWEDEAKKRGLQI